LTRSLQNLAAPIDPEIVLANMVGGIVVLEPAGRIVYVNPAAEAILGRSKRSLVDTLGAVAFAECNWLMQLLVRVDAGGETSVRNEGRVGPGEGIDVVAVVSALRDANGDRHGSLLALHDLTTRHRLERDQVAHTRVEELDRMIATVAHELNNPLSGIRGAAQLLAKKLDANSELAEYANMIVRQSDRMTDLMQTLLGLSAVGPQMEPTNIHRVLNEVLLLEKTRGDEKHVCLVPIFDPSLPKIEGNSAQLQQLFLNIIKNAITACPATSGRVEVATRIETSFYVTTASHSHRYITVEIRDNGPGLDDETAEQMFTPFFSRSGEGHGLGLAIARNITLAHRGQLNAENIAGGGACFRVLLPVAKARSNEST
jgi:two-component system nitrogen regulation sensor histidine kinase GlnL